MISARVFTPKTAAAVAGLKAATLSAWHKRHGLLADTKPGNEARRYTLSEICMIRLLVVLTQHGINLGSALQFVAFWNDSLIERALDDGREPSWFIVFRDQLRSGEFVVTTGSETLAAIMRDMVGPVTVIDLRSMAQYVLSRLGLVRAKESPDEAA